MVDPRITHLEHELKMAREMLESANSIILRLDREGVIRYINEFGQRFFGYSAAELVGQSVMTIVPKVEKSTGRDLEALIQDIIKNPSHYMAVPNENITRDGRIVWVLWTNKEIRDANGEFQEFLSIGNDITALKEVDESLRKSEARYRSILQTSMDGFWLVDMHGQLLDVNETYCQMSGYSRKELLALQIADLEQNESAADIAVHLQRVAHQGSDRFETRHRRRDGTLFDVEVRAQFQPVDTGRVVCFLRDITGSKKAQAELLARERQFSLMAQLSPVGIYMTTPQGECIYVNDFWCEMAGLTHEEALGQGWIKGLHPEDRQVVLDSWEAMVSSQGEWGKEYRFQDKTGKITWVYGVAAPLTDENGKVLQYLGANVNITARKLAESTLQASEEKYRLLVNHLAAGLVVHGPDTAILFSNPMASTLLGLTPDQLQGKMAIDPAWSFLREDGTVLPPESYPVNQALATGEPVNGQVLGIQRPDLPEPVWVKCNSYPVFADEGPLRQVVVTFVDISEQKRAEQAIQKRVMALTRPLEGDPISFDELFNLEEVQRLQDEFARATGVASIITDPNGVPLTAPSNFTRLCREIIRQTEKGCASCQQFHAVLGHHNPEGPNIQHCPAVGLWDAGAGITAGGKHIASWLIGQVRDENQTTAEISACARELGVEKSSFLAAFHEVPVMSHDQFAQVAQTLFTLASQLSTTAYQNIQQARFINELTQVEGRLKSMAQRLQLAATAARFGVWDWNVRENSMIWDDRMFELYGITPEESPNNIDAWLNGLHPEDKEAAVAACQAALNGEKSFDTGFRVCHPNGEVRHLKANGLVIMGKDGKAERMIGINADITEQIRAEEERARLETQLRQVQKVESIGQLAGGVAHDFNNMLGVILGHAELALRKLDPANPVISDLEEISRAANRSADLTRQLLTFARKQAIAPKILNLNEALAGMLNMLQRLIGENIDLAWKPAPDLWAVKVDPSQLDQILANLCVNARDAITGIGKITIATANCTLDRQFSAEHPYLPPGDYVRVSVTDDGRGIPEEILPHIFEPFFTTKEVGAGTGLGLATVFGAVKQNNGFIDVASEPGRGTTFELYFPRVEKSADAEVAAPGERLISGTETILLVEDDEMLLGMVTAMLEEGGYTVLATADVEEAQTIAREHPGPIQLLISDVVMPAMNGRDLRDRLRAFRPDMKVLFTSGYTADIISRQGVIEAGLNFLQKPFSINTLITRVRAILDAP